MMSEPAEEQEELLLQNNTVVQADGSADPNYKVLIFLRDLGPGAVHGIPIILIAQVESKFLVAIPFNSWNRLVRLRLLPANSLSKVVSVAVAAAESDHREQAADSIFIKVWIGFLNPAFEECIIDELGLSAFPTEDEEEGFLPFAEALVAVSDEKFAFMTAESGPADDGDQTRNKIAALAAVVGYQRCLGTADKKGRCRERQCFQGSAESTSYSSGSAIAYKRRWYSWFRQGDRACCSSSWNRSKTVGGVGNYDWAFGEGKDERCPRFGSNTRRMRLNILGESEEGILFNHSRKPRRKIRCWLPSRSSPPSLVR